MAAARAGFKETVSKAMLFCQQLRKWLAVDSLYRPTVTFD